MSNVGTPEIQSIAATSSKHRQSNSIFAEVVSENMKLKLKDAIFNEKIAKSNMISSKIELKNRVKPNTIGGVEFDRILNSNLNMKWKENNSNCCKKVSGLEEKQKKLLAKIYEEKNIQDFTRKKVHKVHTEKMNQIMNLTKYRDDDLDKKNLWPA